jgi:hypothetical protein
MVLAEGLAPLTGRSGVVDECVSGHIAKHLGQLDTLGQWSEQSENLRAANHRYALAAGNPQRLVDIVCDLCAGGTPVAAAGQDDVPLPSSAA